MVPIVPCLVGLLHTGACSSPPSTCTCRFEYWYRSTLVLEDRVHVCTLYCRSRLLSKFSLYFNVSIPVPERVHVYDLPYRYCNTCSNLHGPCKILSSTRRVPVRTRVPTSTRVRTRVLRVREIFFSMVLFVYRVHVRVPPRVGMANGEGVAKGK